MTEQFKLGVHPPIRESGDIADTPGCTLEGPAGSVKLDRGVICALRHIHMTPEDALRYGVRDKSIVRVRIAGDRELVFGDVLVRVDPELRARHAHRHRRSQRGQRQDRRAGLHRRNPKRRNSWRITLSSWTNQRSSHKKSELTNKMKTHMKTLPKPRASIARAIVKLATTAPSLPTARAKPLNRSISPNALRKMDAWWRAANYLSVGQTYLYDNPLLKAAAARRST